MVPTNTRAALPDDRLILRLANEIAMDLYPVETILEHHQVSVETWDKLKSTPVFLRALAGALEEWNAAGNAKERVKIKAAVMIEDWLPTLYGRMNDRDESLSAKIEAGKFVARLADMGVTGAVQSASGTEKFSVTINLGASHQIVVEQKAVSQVIEAEVVSSD